MSGRPSAAYEGVMTSGYLTDATENAVQPTSLPPTTSNRHGRPIARDGDRSARHCGRTGRRWSERAAVVLPPDASNQVIQPP
jgi:hypothetical protein